MRLPTCIYLVAMLAITALTLPTFAQAPTPQSLAGDWQGALLIGQTSLPLVLHLKTAPDGTMTSSLDSPAQSSYGMPGSNVRLSGTAFSFEVPSVHGSYTGTVSADGKSISGTWSQGKPLKLVLKQTATAAELAQVQPSPVDGDWAGTLRASGVSLRVVFHLHAAPGGKIDCTFDSLDQGAMGIPCDNVKLKGPKLTLDAPAVSGTYSGTLSADGNKLSGTWTQGTPLPLELTREAKKPSTVLVAPAPARPPIALKDLKPVLDQEFAPIIAAWPQAGVVVGILDHGQRKLFAYGTAKDDSIFEIGSVTKTFTALALAQMVEQHTVSLDQQVRELLPPDTVSKPASGPEITLLDLATQHSGLPRMPDNFRPANPADPYADYTAKDLYAYMAKQGVGRPEKTEFLYSNLGFGLLGQALADKAGESYGTLIQQQITQPLMMKDTVIDLSPAQQARLIQGYTGSHDKAHTWSFDSMAGAGALRSTADDLLTYVDAYMHPDKLPTASTGPASTLPASLQLAQKPEADVAGGMKIGLAWLIRPDANIYMHDGGTGGYSSLVLFALKDDQAIVVLYNCLDINPGKPQLTNRVAANVGALLDGRPAPPIGD